jgi:hypothetical protein
VTAALLALLSLVLSSWYREYRLLPSDEGAVLAQASRILAGEVYYRDLDAYPLPGASYLLAAAMALFGEHLAVARWLAAAVYAAVVVSLFAVARWVMAPRPALLAGVALLAFKFLAWPNFTAYLYSDVAFALACASVALFLSQGPGRGTGRVFSAGLLAGLALLCKQTVGLYLAGASVALLAVGRLGVGAARSGRGPRLPSVLSYGAGVLAALMPALAYFAAHGVLGSLFESAFLRPLTAYLGTSGVSFTEPLRWWRFGELEPSLSYMVHPYWQLLQGERLPGEAWQPVWWALGELFSRVLYTSVVVAGIAYAALWLEAWRGDPAPRERRVLELGVLAFAVLLSAFPRADFPHLVSVYPLLLVAVFALSRPLARHLGPVRPVLRRLGTLTVVTTLLATLVLAAWDHAFLTHRMELGRATLRVAPDHGYVESVVRYVKDEVPPGEPILVAFHEAHFYFLANRHTRWPFVQIYPGMEGPGAGTAMVAELERDPPRLVVLGHPLPGLPPLGEYAPALLHWIRLHYEPDPEAFRRYPPPSGSSYARVLRRKTRWP